MRTAMTTTQVKPRMRTAMMTTPVKLKMRTVMMTTQVKPRMRMAMTIMQAKLKAHTAMKAVAMLSNWHPMSRKKPESCSSKLNWVPWANPLVCQQKSALTRTGWQMSRPR